MRQLGYCRDCRLFNNEQGGHSNHGLCMLKPRSPKGVTAMEHCKHFEAKPRNDGYADSAKVKLFW